MAHKGPKHRIRALSTIWCAKEAYVKANGDGVGFGLERIEVFLSDGMNIDAVHVDGENITDHGWRTASGWLDDSACCWVYMCHTNGNYYNEVEPITLDWSRIISYVSTRFGEEIPVKNEEMFV